MRLKRAAPGRAQPPCTKEYTNLSSQTHRADVTDAELGMDVYLFTYGLITDEHHVVKNLLNPRCGRFNLCDLKAINRRVF